MILERLISDFDIETLKQFFINKITTFKPKQEDYEYLFEDNENITANYQDIQKIGEADLKNSADLLVIAAKTLTPISERTGKKRQFEIAKKILKEEDKDAAFFIFYDENVSFRFSFIRTNFIGTKRDFTDFKRYTYFVTPEQTNKTFISQISKCNFSDLDSILEAFSVEPLNKEFYKQIANSFYSLIGGKIKNGSKTQVYNSVLQLPSKNIETNRKIFQEFAVRFLGRIVFVWFLKNKTSENNVPLIPKEWLSSEKVKNTNDFYHSYIEKLFFEILNKPLEKRIKNLPEEHKIVPFLNGGLFEPDIEDFYKPDEFGFSQFHNTLKIPDEWILNLFETLEQFNFTIDENSLNDQEVSIDPEMLGTIFENLLAEIDPDTEKSARKSTGSFYTPREIVDYMVEESLVNYLKTKINLDDEKLHQLFKENDLVYNFFENKDQLLNALFEIKILDPACGSGAFPMGALHKINLALQKLDPDAEIWKNKQLKRIDNSVIRQDLKNKLDNSNVEYIRKLGVVQHSIYGVDIQPIAIEIAKLRSFLSLVVDETIDDNDDNRGIYPLPNLEFKFIAANTLIGLDKVKKGDSLSLDFGETENDIDKLQKIRNTYLQEYKEKDKFKKEFFEVQKQIALKEFKGAGNNKRALQISSWNPFSNEKSNWFDPKWMFGVDGFDVVIGNPPYIQLQKALPNGNGNKFADLYKNENYKTFERTGDIYALFYEKGLNILTAKGLLCFITSNKWMRANYGKSLRKFFSEKKPLKLIDLGPGVFNTATVDTNILLIANNVKTHCCASLQAIKLTDKEKISTLASAELRTSNNNGFITLNNLSDESWVILSPEENNIKKKIESIGTPLKDWDINIYRGVLTGFNEAFIIDGKTKNELITQDPKSAEIIKPILRGRDIKRYKAEFADLWLINTHTGYKNSNGEIIPPINIDNYPAIKEHLDQYWDKLEKRQDKGVTPYNLRHCAYLEEFEKEKIVYNDISQQLAFSLCKKNIYFNNTVYFVTNSIFNKYFITLLNTKLIDWYYKRTSAQLGEKAVRLFSIYVQNITIPKITKFQQQPFEIIADKIISKKELGEDSTAEEQEIDIMVYKLYELTYEEVKIIEPTFALTKNDYENYE